MHGAVSRETFKRTRLDRQAAKAKKKPESDPATKAMRVLRKAVQRSKNPAVNQATSFTIVKLRQPPIAKLIDDKKIGPEEMQAADEIEMAFMALASRLMVRGMSLERIDRSGVGDVPWPAVTAKAVGHYNIWASHWTKRANLYGDPMLQVVIAAVIDQRPARVIGYDLGFGREKINIAIVGGLRDFCARAEIVSGGIAAQWMENAEQIFVPQNPKLLDAMRRARLGV